MDPSLYEFGSYGAVLFFFLASIGLCVGMIAANRIIGAKANPNPDKIESYECGEEPIGSAWLRFNIRFYMVALVFVVFDVELALVFPIATVLKDCVNTTTHPGQFLNPTALIVAAELLVFVVILFLGLVYLWKKNDLGWNRVYRENADIEELVQQRLAHLPPVKIRPRVMPAAATAAPKPVAAKAAVAAPAAAPAAGAKPGIPAALAAKLAAAKAAGGAAPAAAPAAPAGDAGAKPGIPAALAAKLAAAKAAAAGGGAAPVAAAPAAPAPAATGGIPPALAAKLAAAKAAAAGGGAAPAAPAPTAAPEAPEAPAAPAAPAEPTKPGGIPPALAAKLAAAKAKAAGQTPPAEGGGGGAA